MLPLFKAGVLIAKTPRGEEGIQGKKVENEHWERYLPMLPVLVNAEREKEVIRDRIAGLASLGHEERPVKGEDVFLYQAGMSAISHAHDALIEGYSEGGKRLFVEFG